MPTSPSSSVQTARQRLGEQLRDIRMAARLTGREFAHRAGWADATNVSKVERAQRTITADHVRLWCRICEVAHEREAELLAEQANVARMWVTFREAVHQIGLNPTQRLLVGDIYDRLKREQVYQTKLIPGLLQTAAYMTGVLTDVRHERGLAVDDVAEAVTERLGRQRNLHRPGVQFAFIVEEPVMWQRPFGAEAQAGQLRHLLAVMRLPAVSFGVIPARVDRRGHRPRESFDITDDELVTVELISGYLSLTHPADVAMYRRVWADLVSLAVFGANARALVTAALESLNACQCDSGR
jgi:transcriptional regulator with XRE-family HTH domain